jgi:NitT/TauT family transport system permease protein
MSVDVTQAERPERATTDTFVSSPRGRLKPATHQRARTSAIQLVILAAFLLGWQFLPKVGWLSSHFKFLDPYFISSPAAVWGTLKNLVTGANGSPELWPYARSTIEASILGTLIGTLLGAGVGLLLSNSPTVSDVLRPFLIAVNAVPRVALIPIIVIIFGPTVTSSTITAVTVVFFVVFFNAYEGGRTVPADVLENARMLGATSSQLMFRVRWRYVLAWTVTALPNATSFGLVSVVTAEILTGTVGMGRLLLDSVTSVQASLTFAVVVVLSVLGILLVAVTALLRRRWLHWWARD